MRTGRWVAAVLFLLPTLASEGTAQELARQVEGARDGWVTFQVEVEDNVEVCDRGIRIRHPDGDGYSHWSWNGRDQVCGPGPLQVELELRDGRVAEMRARRVRSLDGARSLGPVDPLEASEYLVSLAYRNADREVAEEGFFLARLPRGADPAPGIVRAARDRELSSGVRKSALFWAGQLAAEEVVSTLSGVALEEDEDQEVRDAAVFALSQHQGERALPALMELATDAPHAKTRKTALFWLAQNDTPEVADFLADLILGRRGG